MEILGKYIYGSANSLDTDMVYLVDQLPDSIAECKKFCDEHKNDNDNLNIAVLEDGIISKCFKGTPDELNNAIIFTYLLHYQDTHLLINRRVERDLYLKLIRSVRSILSHFSKSCLRSEIKAALRGSWSERLEALKKISLLTSDNVDLDSLNPNMSGRDVMKLVAFQIGQVKGLLEGIELYTKNNIGHQYESLRDFLNRESNDWPKLSKELYNFYSYLLYNIKYTDNSTNVTFIDSKGNEYVYDLKLEKKLNC